MVCEREPKTTRARGPAALVALVAPVALVALVAACDDAPAAVDAAVDPGFEPPPQVCAAGDVPGACCAGEARPVPTTARTVIDLSGAATIAGRCAPYAVDGRGLVLPADPAAYPVKLVLPAFTAPDPACATTCAGGGVATTTFGVALELPDGLIGGNSGRGLAVLAHAPWRFVSGGCGEACAWPCLDGYQEFGVAACVSIGYGDFGLATAAPSAPSTTALVELVAHDLAQPPTPRSCCPYPP